jgi:S-ribosylhomocysteine lyase
MTHERDTMIRDYDHTTVQAPYLYCAEDDRSDGLTLWHLRVTQPNQECIPPATAHSLEHVLIYRLRALDERMSIAAPMGCGTGYYIAAANLTDFDTMAHLIAEALTWAADADQVPWADEVRCGMAAMHDLAGVQDLARRLLDQRAAWGSPGPDARLISPEAS